MILFLSSENPCKKSRLPSTSVTLPPHLLLIHLHFIVPHISLHHCCALFPLAHVQVSRSHSLLLPEPELHTLFRAFSTPTPSIIMTIYTARTVILHHPACHIPCFLLSPHFYHPSVPSGIRSFYQWSGASALSGARSRSRWEAWCWKDSAQGRRTQKSNCTAASLKPPQWLCLHLSNTHQLFGWLLTPQKTSA